MRRYREENAERMKAQWADYHQRNRDKRLEQHRAWIDANRDRMREYSRRGKRMRRLNFSAVDLDYAEIIKSDPCVYCGAVGGTVEHIQAMSRGGSSEWTNLASACRSCNMKKHATPLLHFLLTR